MSQEPKMDELTGYEVEIRQALPMKFVLNNIKILPTVIKNETKPYRETYTNKINAAVAEMKVKPEGLLTREETAENKIN